jgi:predicted lipoprotein with Yx(FWY)xxD motif
VIPLLPALLLAAAPALADERPLGIGVHMTPGGEVFADPAGLTLYVYDKDTVPGVSTCLEACAVSWPPVAAAAGARPFGDWSLVERPGGVRQWAYRGKPLYRYALEQKPGWAMGDGGGSWNLALTSWQFPQRNSGRAAAGPKEEPIELPPSPGGVGGRRAEGSAVMADHRGMTLYAASGAACGGPCLDKRPRFTAPMAAVPIGEWTIAGAARQWAYRGQPVHTCADDRKPGEVACETASEWRALRP